MTKSVVSHFNQLEGVAVPLWQRLHGKTFFLTGGTGFFGKWLLSFFQAGFNRGFDSKLVVLSRDPGKFIREFPQFIHPSIEFMEGDANTFNLNGRRFDAMLHGAASTDWRIYSADPQSMLSSLEKGAQNFLLEAEKSSCSNVHLMSSGAVYGPQLPNILHQTEDSELPDFSLYKDTYAAGKRRSEELFLNWGRSTKSQVSISRSFAFLGPHLPLDLHFAAGNFIGACLGQKDLVIRGDGTALRSYLYPADLAIWLMTILLDGAPQSVYNLGSERAFSILQLAEGIRKVAIDMGCQPGSVIVQQAPVAGVAPARYVPSTHKARTELKLNEWMDFTGMVSRTIQFHLKSKDSK